MNRTKTRKSRRLADKHRRVGKGSKRMSVGEALDADTHGVDVTNLVEAHAMQSARKAVALREQQTPPGQENPEGREEVTLPPSQLRQETRGEGTLTCAQQTTVHQGQKQTVTRTLSGEQTVRQRKPPPIIP